MWYGPNAVGLNLERNEVDLIGRLGWIRFEAYF